jgi:hypothetical protein
MITRILLATLVLAALAAQADAYLQNHINPERPQYLDRLAQPFETGERPPARVAPLPNSDPRKAAQEAPAPANLLEALKDYKPLPPEPPMTRRDIREIERSYQNMRNEPYQKGDYSKCAAGGCPLEQAAKECGEKAQVDCSPSRMGGRTMCGMSVAQAIACMRNHLPQANKGLCYGKCGHGNMFVNCSSGQMGTCGYEKISSTDNRCKMPGAVLAYSKSPTPRGAIYGHVEFVCGRDKYCSVYRQPLNRPWPRSPPDACWYPKGVGGA